MREIFPDDYIIIAPKRLNGRQRTIISKSPFLTGEVIITVDNDRILFRKPEIDYQGKTHKMSINKNSRCCYTSIVAESPYGKFYFDADESDEDCVVVYPKEQSL